MNLEQAKRVIRDAEASFASHCEAAVELSTSTEATYEDLLACLRYRGLPAELGAIALYKRTGRPRQDDSPVSVITDIADWTKYLGREPRDQRLH